MLQGHGGAFRHVGLGGHHQHDPGEGAGRRGRRLHHRAARADRAAPTALPALPVLQLAAAARRRLRQQGQIRIPGDLLVMFMDQPDADRGD